MRLLSKAKNKIVGKPIRHIPANLLVIGQLDERPGRKRLDRLEFELQVLRWLLAKQLEQAAGAAEVARQRAASLRLDRVALHVAQQVKARHWPWSLTLVLR